MKKVAISSLFLSIISFTGAALILNIEDFKTAVLVTDNTDSVSNFLSIPSDIDYIIESDPLISVEFDGESGGLDWFYVYNTTSAATPIAVPLVTVRLTDIEVFVDQAHPSKLSLWNDVQTVQLDTIGITVPEPATLSLLALGGAVLLRRRK